MDTSIIHQFGVTQILLKRKSFQDHWVSSNFQRQARAILYSHWIFSRSTFSLSYALARTQELKSWSDWWGRIHTESFCKSSWYFLKDPQQYTSMSSGIICGFGLSFVHDTVAIVRELGLWSFVTETVPQQEYGIYRIPLKCYSVDFGTNATNGEILTMVSC